VAVVHFLEEAHNRLRTMLQADRFVVDQFKEDPLATRLPVQVMGGMVEDTMDMVPTASEAGTRRGIAMVHMQELSGVG
jgi:hypothetical protein